MEKGFEKVAVVKGFEGDTLFHDANNPHCGSQSDGLQIEIEIEIETLIHEYVEKQDIFKTGKRKRD